MCPFSANQKTIEQIRQFEAFEAAEVTYMSAMEEYVVDKNLCIDCNACYTTYPEVFKQVPWQGETKAEAYAPISEGKLNPWDVIGVCPTEAITKKGEMPAKPEAGSGEAAAPKLEDLGPWEDRWARVKNQQESKWEVMKRYGMAATVEEQSDRFFIKVQFPERAPLHIMTYQLGLPDTLPDYEYDVELNADHTGVIVKGWLKDPHFKKLTGKINSFPDRFRREFKLPNRVEILRKAYRSRVLTLELRKVYDETASVA